MLDESGIMDTPGKAWPQPANRLALQQNHRGSDDAAESQNILQRFPLEMEHDTTFLQCRRGLAPPLKACALIRVGGLGLNITTKAQARTLEPKCR